MGFRRRVLSVAQCVVVDAGTGAVTATADDPCTTLLLVTPAEYGSFSASPFSVISDPADAATLAVAIAAVWAVAWGFRALVKALDTDGEALEG